MTLEKILLLPILMFHSSQSVQTMNSTDAVTPTTLSCTRTDATHLTHNTGSITSRDRSCRNPHTQAATDTGDTKNNGMKTRSQKWVPLSILSHTRTSNISSRRWMPTAMSIALNSTQVSPSALKREGSIQFSCQKKSTLSCKHPKRLNLQLSSFRK